MEKAILAGLRRVRRPFSWFVLLVGCVGFLLTFPFGVIRSYSDDSFWITLVGFAVLILDGYDKVVEVEFDDEGNLTEVD